MPIVGGLHLRGPKPYPRIPPAVELLSQVLKLAPMYILPLHYSGPKVKMALEQAFGEECRAASSARSKETRL
jgi:7,8-dihydropterin-6-yl-methyl-4-(beta-D-ribofuranosyl)aminobenzene 5'-phosphate synthase